MGSRWGSLESSSCGAEGKGGEAAEGTGDAREPQQAGGGGGGPLAPAELRREGVPRSAGSAASGAPGQPLGPRRLAEGWAARPASTSRRAA